MHIYLTCHKTNKHCTFIWALYGWLTSVGFTALSPIKWFVVSKHCCLSYTCICWLFWYPLTFACIACSCSYQCSVGIWETSLCCTIDMLQYELTRLQGYSFSWGKLQASKLLCAHHKFPWSTHALLYSMSWKVWIVCPHNHHDIVRCIKLPVSMEQ